MNIETLTVKLWLTMEELQQLSHILDIADEGDLSETDIEFIGKIRQFAFK